MAASNADCDDECAADFDDMVLSDIHVLNGSVSLGQKENLSLSRFFFKRPRPQNASKQLNESLHNERGMERAKTLIYDEDGDLVVHRDEEKDGFELITIVHKMATPLGNVGLQVWRGALFLSDFILHERSRFELKNCIELGAGVGLSGIVAGIAAKTIFITDYGDLTLRVCEENVKRNEHLLENGSDVIRVRELNWHENEYKSNETEFGWSSKDLEYLKEIEVILAADVIYEDCLTDALMSTILKLIETSNSSTICIYLAVEKRLNFTLQDLDIACPAYNHFMDCLQSLCNSNNKQTNSVFKVFQVDGSFPQYFNYDRVKEMELWEIRCCKVPIEI